MNKSAPLLTAFCVAVLCACSPQDPAPPASTPSPPVDEPVAPAGSPAGTPTAEAAPAAATAAPVEGALVRAADGKVVAK